MPTEIEKKPDGFEKKIHTLRIDFEELITLWGCLGITIVGLWERWQAVIFVGFGILA